MATQSLKLLENTPVLPPVEVIKTNPHSRYIPEKLKLKLRLKAQGQCEYVSRETGRRCGAKKYLQIDHRKPFSLFGETREENLRVLCASHNLLYAEKWLGTKKMAAFKN